MSLPEHGSNPSHLIQALALEHPGTLIDFSVNVNPFGIPPTIRNMWGDLIELIADYPDPQSMKLKHQLADYEQINMNHILIGNGAAELIYLLAHAFQETDVLVVDPTFSEYRTACEIFHCRVHSYLLKEENGWQLDVEELITQLPGKAALFICHPNNPTGVRYEKEQLLYLLKKAQENQVTVIIDEAFYDFCLEPESMLAYVAEFSNLVILRSFTKMFAIPGIRLGWLAASESMIDRLTKMKIHWSVNAVAEEIGTYCLQEDSYVERTRRWIFSERNRVTSALTKLGFTVSKSTVNYYLLREGDQKDAQSLLRFLLTKGVVARHTENFIGLDGGTHLRFAVRTEAENDILITALESWRSQC